MFTGIIEELGTIRGVSLTKDGGELQIAATTVLGGTKLGDSIAVNGTCLTVTKLEKDGFTAFVMAESLRRTNLGNLKRGSVVHLERAMAADGRFGGHMVTGHIDGQGTFLSQKPEGQAVVLTIVADPEILSGIVEKGSIAIDGTSLTVMDVGKDSFRVGMDYMGVNRYANAFETALAWLKDGRIVSERMITHRFPLSRIQEGFDWALAHPNETIKVIIYND